MEKLEKFSTVEKPSKQYYPKDIEEKILEGVDIPMYEYVKQRNIGHENDPTYSYFGEVRDFKYFDKKIEECALALKKYGLSKGDTITICLPNIPETMIYFYACNRIGVTPYLIDPRCSEKRIIECMNISNSKLLISLIDIMNKTVNSKNIPSDSIIVVSPGESFFKNKNLNSKAEQVKALYTMKDYIYRMKEFLIKDSNVKMHNKFVNNINSNDTLIDASYDPDIPAAIVNTSGTTGTPKGAMQSNRAYNITANQIDYVAPIIKRGMTYFGYIPIFTLYGSSVGMHAATSHGIVIDLIPKIDTHKFDQIFVETKPNITIGVPRLYDMFPESEAINKNDLSFGKLLVMGGDKCDPTSLKVINDTLEKNGCEEKITYGYGTTEAMMVASTTGDPNTYVYGSCGTLYPGVNVRITDRETLKELPYGEKGEIYVDTPAMFMGYIGNLEETNSSIYIDPQTGIKYYKTGDRGYITEDGILYHDGRYKRLMKRPDGHQVNSVPIENEIMKCEDVNDCAVVGIRNSYQAMGVVPTAFIEFKNKNASIEDLKEVIRQIKDNISGERELALAYTIIDKIPYTINGKKDFKKLETIKFEDISYVILEDPVLNGYFTQGEELIKVKLNQLNKNRLILKK